MYRMSVGKTVIAFAVAFSIAATPVSAQQRPPAPVTVAEAVEQDVAAGQLFVATVMPLKRVTIGSAVDGRVVELMAEEGQRVSAKQPLAQLLTNTIELELAGAVAELDLRKQELAELENGTRREDLEQAKARMLGAKANWQYARTEFERNQRLLNSKANSQGEFEKASAFASSSEQAYYELKAAYDLAVAGPRPEKIGQARAQFAIQSATVDKIRDRIKKYTVIPQFDGYVTSELTEAGAWLKSGDPVMEILALDEVEVRGFVAEQHVPHVRRGTHVRVEVPSLPDRIFTGVVTMIVPQADMRARTFPVNVRVKNEITNEGPLLKSGMYARIELPTGEKQAALMVSKDALVLGGSKPIVYVVDTGDDPKSRTGKVTPVLVELGVASAHLIQVKGALKKGQWVVVEGNERLQPGQEVNVTSIRKPIVAATARK